MPTTSPAISNGKSEAKEWHEIAWERAGGEASGVTKATVKAMGVVAEAPETAAKVAAGEIRQTRKAVLAAREELGDPVPDGEPVVSAGKSLSERLTAALYDLRMAAVLGIPVGTKTLAENEAVLDEIEEYVERLRRKIRATR